MTPDSHLETPTYDSGQSAHRGDNGETRRAGLGTIVFWAVIAIVAAAAVWLVGSFALRVIGLIVIAASLLSLGVTAGTGHFTAASGASLGGLCLGPALWLAGHWLYAFKRQYYKSPFAQRAPVQRAARSHPEKGACITPSDRTPGACWGTAPARGDRWCRAPGQMVYVAPISCRCG